MKTLRLCLAIFASITVCAPLYAQNAQPQRVSNRITATIDETNRVALPGNVHPMAQARFDQGAAPGSLATGRIMLILQRSAAQQQALTQYLDDVQNPSSASYHKWLTPAQYGAAFGISDSDLQTVQAWLESYGFKIEKVPAARNLIQFSGTVGQVQSAFNTSIHRFSLLGATHYANVSDPQIPAALAPVVAGVTPLNDFHPAPHVVRGPSGRYDAATHSIQPELTLGGSVLYIDPADAATIYDTPNANLNANFSGTTYDGAGVYLGIVGVSDLTVNDVQNYRMAFLGETSGNVNMPTVIVEGDDPGLNGAGTEALLDAEVSGGIAPKAKIYFYTSADTDLTSGLFNAVLRAIDDNAVSILSMSFGECEATLGTSGNNFMNEAAQEAAAQGISFVVSAGDGGSAGCDNFDTETQATFGLAVSGMASTPWTIAVGGTDFDGLPAAFSTYASTAQGTAPYYRTALKYIPENPWNDSTTVDTTLASNVRDTRGGGNIVAGSGGISIVYTKPAYQSSLTPADGVRDLPDVSLFASNGHKSAVWAICSDSATDGATSTYTDCQTSGGALASGTPIGGAGGTSASAPAFAGMLALVSQSLSGARLGQVNTVLYQLAKTKYATVFHDVTVGNNSVPCASGSTNCGTNGFLSGYNTATGYDMATGLGSVDVQQMISNWSSVGLTATSTTLTLNGSAAAYTGTHGATVNFAVGVTPTAATGAAAVIDTAGETSGGSTAGPQNNGQLSIALSGGAGTASYNGLPGGTYTVSARYSGDTSDASSSSTPINVTIAPEASTTSLAVNAYSAITGNGLAGLTAVPYGSYVFADAEITGTAEGTNTQGTATGRVTFLDGTFTLGTAAVTGNGNLASWPAQNASFAVLPTGTHSITASYGGDPSFNASTSTAVAVTVVKANTSLTATTSAASITSAQSVTVTVKLTTAYNLGAAPTGSVTLTANASTVGTITSFTQSLVGTNYVYTGTATVQGSALIGGSNTIAIAYLGDANYATSSTSATVSVTTSGSFTLSNSGNDFVQVGNSTASTLTVTPSGGFTGSVNITCAVQGTPAGLTCTAPAANVTGTTAATTTLTVATTSGTPAGVYTATVTAKDAATSQITANTTLTITVTTTPPVPGVTLGAAPSTLSLAGGASTGNTSTISVNPVGGFTGAVTLTCAVTTSISNPTSTPTCAVTSPVTISGTTSATSTLTIASQTATTAGAYTATVNAAAAGGITASVPVAVTITSNTPAIALTSANSITVAPGAATGNTSVITVTPSGGFTGQVNMTCAVTTSPSGASDLPTCSVASVMITGTSAVTATLSVTTTAATSGAMHLPLEKFFVAGGGGVLAMVLFFGIPARRRAWQALFSVLALVVLAGGAIGCGGGGSSGGGGTKNTGTTAGSYTITVTGTDAATGKVTSTVAVSVTVT